MKGVAADLKNKVAAHGEKPFVLLMVQMQGRAAFLLAKRVIDAEVAAGVARGNLAIEASAHDQKLLAATVSLRFHLKAFIRARRLLGFGVQPKGRCGGGELKEQAPLHLDSCCG